MKDDGEDVYIPCFGEIRGCLVNHCDAGKACREATEERERIDPL